MAGKDSIRLPQEHKIKKHPVFEVQNLCSSLIANVNFVVNEGETLELSVPQAATKQFCSSCCMVSQEKSGSMLLDGVPIQIRHPADAKNTALDISHQTALIQASSPSLPCLKNISLCAAKKLGQFGF